MGYDPTPADQWTQDDLDSAEAAKDYGAVEKARRAGQLHDILNPPKEISDSERLDTVLATQPVGPTVPGQQPGGGLGLGSGPVQMTQGELDALDAAQDYAAINEARRAGRLRDLGTAPSKQL